ncbi:receptor-type tyrosine-protein phosphatase F [Exaiptasia diaphana]|uniref:Uncharacterized protein n=1 Tax=Exaiptasia diaphana TaxID=2652724 RepID=A0A913YQA6_EXADI|nr:receptor-type tyrosine-protein phosphatase F [Exaiptasia diaphana]
MDRVLRVLLYGFTVIQLADAAVRFTRVPADKLYVVKGQTARFTWDYHVDNINTEFDSRSPRWYFHNNSSLLIGYGDLFDGRKFKIYPNTCPPRLLTPTVRVSVEVKATLVITDVTMADSGTYGCRLVLSSGSLSSMPTNEAKLIVTETPSFTKKPNATTSTIEHSDLNISCTAVGLPTPVVTWVQIKQSSTLFIIKGIGGAVLHFADIKRNQSGTYECHASNNPNESLVRARTMVIVSFPPGSPSFNYTEGDGWDAAVRFTRVPADKLYVVKGQTARFTWDYHVDNINTEFDSRSPRWYFHNNSSLLIGYGDLFDGRKFKIYPNTCPPRLLTPTVRVSVEVKATLVITDVTMADSGTYGCRLVLSSGSLSSMPTNEAKLIVTETPSFTKKPNATTSTIEHSDLNISCTAVGLPTPVVTWVQIKQSSTLFIIKGIGGAVLHFADIKRNQSGTYECHASNNPNESLVRARTMVIVSFPPGSPSFNVTDIEASSAVVRWAEPVDNGGSKVTGYKVEIDSKTYNFSSWKPNHFVIPGLTKNKVYVVKLFARNVAGYGNASSKTFTTKKEGPPGSPVLKIVKFSNTTVTLMWSKPEENGGEIEYYTIYKKLSGAEWSQIGTLSGEPLTYTVKDLLPGKTYSFHVTAKNKDGSSLMGVNVITVTLPVETTTPNPATSAITSSRGSRIGPFNDFDYSTKVGVLAAFLALSVQLMENRMEI